MKEKEPTYFKKFREHIDKKFDEAETKTDKSIIESETRTSKLIEKSIVDSEVRTGKLIEKSIVDSEVRTGKLIEKSIVDSEVRTGKLIEKSIDDLAITTYNQYYEVIKRLDKHDERFDNIEYEIGSIKQNMATKDDVKEILSHIGRYEVRAQNIEETLLQDHKPRIANLEKEVFA
jgi:hypothetical protein